MFMLVLKIQFFYSFKGEEEGCSYFFSSASSKSNVTFFSKKTNFCLFFEVMMVAGIAPLHCGQIWSMKSLPLLSSSRITSLEYVFFCRKGISLL